MSGDPKPFVKWAGGKRQLVEELKKKIPHKYNRYLEPFVGAGALFFELKPKTAYISDINDELIGVYRVIRDEVEALIRTLGTHRNEEEYFYQIRNVDRKGEYKNWSAVKKAARFIYLNRTCYNGLYRVNSKGFFNVPYGFYKNPKIVDKDTLRACSELLKDTEIVHGSFWLVLDKVGANDFVYFDPPYYPLNATSSFTSYTKDGFDQDMQFELKELCDRVDKKGVYFMVSNSHTPFITDLYRQYNVYTADAIRAINCKAEKRGRIKEVIITNY